MTALLGVGPMAGADTETNSKNPEDARLLQICLTLLVPGRNPDVRTTLVDPGDGVDIPAEATAVNGLTLERVRSEGKPVAEVLDVWLADIADAARAGLPLVIQNAPYDLTVLDREARRNDVPTLDDRLDGAPLVVIDPIILDKQCIKFRRRVSDEQGARCLKTLCAVYGVPWNDGLAHDAEYDTIQACRVVWRIGQWSRKSYPQLKAMRLGPFDPPKAMRADDARAFMSLADMSLEELHAAQQSWYAQQSESLGCYWRGEAHKARLLAEQHANRLAECDFDPADADDIDKALAAAEAEADDYEMRVASLTTDWPIIPCPAVTS